MKKMLWIMVVVAVAFSNLCAQSEATDALLYSHKFSILAGLIQPTALKGGNVEINYFTKRVSFDYSHGFSLDIPAAGDFKEQSVVLHLPYSTGFGVGYRFSSFFDLRFEPKLHSWEVYYKDAVQNEENKIIDFKTMTLGIGAYYRYFPFKNSKNKVLQGITTSSSVRYWQNVGTTLRNDAFTYLNKPTNKTETLKAPNIGFGNTPLVINIAIGYTFGGR
jgi:hypothetical protein